MPDRARKPWHDTVLHECRAGSGLGPVVPVTREPPHRAKVLEHVQCAACGEDWIENDVKRLVRIWWSKGAWDGFDEGGANG